MEITITNGELRKYETLVSKKGKTYYKLYFEDSNNNPFQVYASENVLSSYNIKLEQGNIYQIKTTLNGTLWLDNIKTNE